MAEDATTLEHGLEHGLVGMGYALEQIGTGVLKDV